MRLTSSLLALAALLIGTHPATATPFFARTYHFTCVTCHSGVPRLNSFGQYFKANNFRIPGAEKDAPLAWEKTVPLALQIQPTYERFSPGASKAQFTDTQLLAGGLLSPTTSFYIHDSLWIDDKPLAFPTYDAWMQQVLSERYKLMMKLGQFELPYDYSPLTNRITVFSPLVLGAGIQRNDVALSSAMRGIQFSGIIPGGTHVYIATGAPSLLSSGNTNGQLAFFGDFRDVFVRIAGRNPEQNIGGFVYLTSPTRNPADPSSQEDGQRYGIEGKLIRRGFQFDGVVVYGQDSNPLGVGGKGTIKGGFIEVNKVIRPWVSVTARADMMTISTDQRVQSDALTLSTSFYPVPSQQSLRLTAEYQAANHGRSSTAILASVSF